MRLWPYRSLLRNTPIGIKVLIPPVVLILALGAVSLLAIYGLNEQGAALSTVNDIALDKTSLIEEFILLSEQVQSDVFHISVLCFMNLPKDQIQPLHERLEQGLSDLNIIYGQILTKWPLDETERSILERMKEPMDAFRQQALQAVVVVSDNPSFGVPLVRSSAIPFAEFRATLTEFLDYQQAKITQAEVGADQRARTVSRAIVALVLLVALAGTLATVLISSRLIARPIHAMTALIGRLAGGELSMQVGDLERRDEIGAMARAVDVFRNNLEALREVGLEITAQLDLDALLHSIVLRAVELLGGTAGGFGTYQPDEDVLDYFVHTGIDSLPSKTILQKGEGFCGTIWETGEPLIVDDYKLWEGRSAAWEDHLFHAADVGVPVRWSDKFLGVLDVMADPPHTFSLADAELLSLLATQAAIAIHNAQLYKRAQKEIAERKRAEEEIEQLRRQNELILNSAGEGIFGLDSQGRHTFVNLAAARMLGYEVEELLGEPSHATWHHTKPNGSPYPEDECPIYAACRDGVIRRGDDEVFWRKDGSSLPVEYVSNPIGEPGEVMGAVVVFKDITERKRVEERLRRHRELLEEQVEERTVELKQAIDQLQREAHERKRTEEALWESEAKFRIIHDTASALILAHDRDFRVVYMNPYACKVLGYKKDEMIGKDIRSMLEKSEYERAEPVREQVTIDPNMQVEGFEQYYLKKEGGCVLISWNVTALKDAEGNAVGILGVGQDITERREMEERLMRREKLAVLGQLAGGVGHELRNPLGAIKNAGYFLNMVLEESSPEVKETLDILKKEVGTCEKIISSLLGFARARSPTRRKVNVNKIVQEALSRTFVPDNIEVVHQLDKSLPIILADPDQLRQVFGNVILNAVQAMLDGGRLVVKSQVVDLNWVTVSITDTGVGISEENLGKIFEPLFTTRAKGIGLGLALVKSWVEGHEGAIEVESEVGKGSTFTVRLPVSGERVK